MAGIDPVEIARAQGAAYVWGRQDAGERETGYSVDFSEAWAERVRQAETGETAGRPDIRTFYEHWRDTGRIGLGT